jgi:hypothetical protein
MQPDAQLSWGDPVDQLLSLRVALKFLLARNLNPSERFDRATFPLGKYQLRDFPEPMRPPYERIVQARVSVRRDYIGSTAFEFSRLSVLERRALQSDLIALYEACLLDIGKMSATSTGGDNGYYDVVYPRETDRRSLAKRPRPGHAR